ncbi:MAG: ParB N-terminal domain-containing protein [Beijerinckiaceae bacterium]|nr:ParB N-terminal domain-containing protein [Beijerinckiaceae bacterium]
MKVELVAIEKVLPYARNPRKNEGAVAKVAASLKEFGWRQPIVVDNEMVIVVGHTRLMAARSLGMPEVPVHVAEGLTPAQVKAYRLADNRVHEEAEWDEALLKLEIEELQLEGFALSQTGFDDDELARLLADETGGLTDPDEAPPVPAQPVSVLGDLWVLGRHRIVCGSSTEAGVVDRVLAGVKPHLMVTDPLYGVNYDPAWRKRAGVGGEGTAVGVVLNDDRADWREAWDLFPGSVAYVWHGGLHAGVVEASLKASRFGIRSQIVWVKTRFALSRGHYHWQHEPAWYGVREDAPDDNWRFVPDHEVAAYAVKEGQTADWAGGRKQSTVWFIEHLKSDTGHGTQKPVDCMKRPIENNSSPGQAIYEPFSGSGTTIIAAEMTGRSCHAIELNPAYVDVAIERWQAFTGKAAVLEGSTDTFDQVKARRLSPAAPAAKDTEAKVKPPRKRKAA